MRVGVLGAGQLGQMLGQAGNKLNLELKFCDPSSEPITATLAPTVRASFTDRVALRTFVADLDVLTYEFENVPVSALVSVADLVEIAPSIQALTIAQDRIKEKSLFNSLGIPTARFLAAESAATLKASVAAIGLPCIVKTTRQGYDGKGQHLIKSQSDLESISDPNHPHIVEQFISFDRELSIIAVRSKDDLISFYPLVQNVHRTGILRISYAPASDITSTIQAKAEAMVSKLLLELNYVGVLTLELFQVGQELLANEMAPRVHNSGHWTIEGAQTSQFENHLRAIAGLNLGSTEAIGFSQMINIIGVEPDLSKLRGLEQCQVHMYGKTPRPDRKLGHVTICTDSRQETERMGKEVLAQVGQ